MSYEITIKATREYVHATISGEETVDNVTSVWKQIIEACKQHGCKKILCDGILQGSTPILDIFSFGTQFRELGIPSGAAIAIVCKQEEFEKMQFVTDVVANRSSSMQLGLFLDRDEAKKWLAIDQYIPVEPSPNDEA